MPSDLLIEQKLSYSAGKGTASLRNEFLGRRKWGLNFDLTCQHNNVAFATKFSTYLNVCSGGLYEKIFDHNASRDMVSHRNGIENARVNLKFLSSIRFSYQLNCKLPTIRCVKSSRANGTYESSNIRMSPFVLLQNIRRGETAGTDGA